MVGWPDIQPHSYRWDPGGLLSHQDHDTASHCKWRDHRVSIPAFAGLSTWRGDCHNPFPKLSPI